MHTVLCWVNTRSCMVLKMAKNSQLEIRVLWMKPTLVEVVKEDLYNNVDFLFQTYLRRKLDVEAQLPSYCNSSTVQNSQNSGNLIISFGTPSTFPVVWLQLAQWVITRACVHSQALCDLPKLVLAPPTLRRFVFGYILSLRLTSDTICSFLLLVTTKLKELRIVRWSHWRCMSFRIEF